jgi:AraC family L-rhamnose operon regulatory protein RhaS
MKDEFPFWIKRFVHSFNDKPKLHIHDFVELTFVVRGEADHLFEGEQYPIAAGDVFIINPGEVHTYMIQPGKQIEIINCLFLPHLIEDSLLLALKLSDSMDYFYVQPFLDKNERFNHRLSLQGEDAESVLFLLEDMIKEKEIGHSGHDALIRLKLIELLILLSRYYDLNHKTSLSRTPPGEIVVRRICGYLERHFHQKISLPMLSELFNISIRQLNRLFKKENGLSVIETVHQIRIHRAKQMLRETDEKVIVIAAMVGYENPAFFSRLFNRIVGCPPGKYRASGRSETVDGQ